MSTIIAEPLDAPHKEAHTDGVGGMKLNYAMEELKSAVRRMHKD